MTNRTKSEFTSHCRVAAKTNFLMLFPARFAHARYSSRMIDRFLNWGDDEKPKSGKIKGRCQPPLRNYLRKFGGAGSLDTPCHCIQHGEHFIVSDAGDHSIKMFDLEGNFISNFGKQGNEDGEFNQPRFLSINKEGLLMVCDSQNHRVQVFELCGKFVTKFGSEGSERGKFHFPRSSAILSDGRIVVSDWNNDRIQVFEHT